MYIGTRFSRYRRATLAPEWPPFVPVVLLHATYIACFTSTGLHKPQKEDLQVRFPIQRHRRN